MERNAESREPHNVIHNVIQLGMDSRRIFNCQKHIFNTYSLFTPYIYTVVLLITCRLTIWLGLIPFSVE